MVRPWTQAFALVVSASLIVTNADFALAIQPAAVHPPARLGTLTESYPGNSNRNVILIQDLHARYGVQRNIAGLLDYLNHRQPFVLTVEGATGPVDAAVMALFPDSRAKRAALDYLMK